MKTLIVVALVLLMAIPAGAVTVTINYGDSTSDSLILDSATIDQNGNMTVTTPDNSGCQAESPFVFDPATLPNAYLSVAYNQVVTVTATPYSVTRIQKTGGSMPPGLVFQEGSGYFRIMGTPSALGSWTVAITAIASSGLAKTQFYTITVQ